jgi:dATP pyrophosphohydrolase
VTERPQRLTAGRASVPERPGGAAEPHDRTPGLRRPESVLVIIHTVALECLLLERVDPPGFWQSVTGSLHWDETPRAAAAREVREETGIDPAALRDAGLTRQFPILPAWRPRYAPDVDTNTEHRWYLQLPERVTVTINPAEHLRFRWLPLEEAIRLAASWTNREALKSLAAGGAGT